MELILNCKKWMMDNMLKYNFILVLLLTVSQIKTKYITSYFII